MRMERHFAFGRAIIKQFRLWSRIASTRCNLEGDGYFVGDVKDVRAGDTYRFLLDGEGPFPDPASRYQPEGPHGPSQIIDPSHFAWTDQAWQGIKLAHQVIYELHIGTFTREGTWRSASPQLPVLAELGITAIEVMPVAEFAGSFGWGYDGVDLFAPTRIYGAPDDFRAFVDAAHRCGIGVLLDVVYNHVGPDGNYLRKFSESYFTADHKTDWGEAINFYGQHSAPVREFYAANAAYWIKEFHLDGLRLDATQNVYDKSKDHILAEINRSARKAAGQRGIIVVAENEPQDTTLIRPQKEGGYGFDGLWNDDFHHSAMVALTGSREAYFADYLGSPQELLSSLEVWLPLSRAVVFLAETKARHVHVRQQSSRNGDVSAKSRPDRQFRSRLANSSTLLLWAIQSDDRGLLARPRNADAVPRPGICVVFAVCLFCRPQWRSGGKG